MPSKPIVVYAAPESEIAGNVAEYGDEAYYDKVVFVGHFFSFHSATSSSASFSNLAMMCDGILELLIAHLLQLNRPIQVYGF